VAALKVAVSETAASKVHWPVVTYCTVNPLAVHTVGVVETTDAVPSLSVLTTAVNDLVTLAEEGRFEIVSVEGSSLPTLKD
jgi:hypothetical protein